jgi:hypothetical protein
MKRAASRRGSFPALCILLALLFVLCADGTARAQVGIYSRPSDFYLPSQRVGTLGGRYTYSNSSSINTTPLAPETNPLNVKMAPRDGYGGGQRTEDRGRSIPSLLSPAYSTVPPSLGQLGTPMAGGMGAPMASPLATPIGGSAPEYGLTLFPRRNSLFDPTVKADSFARMPPRREASLDNITPYGPTAGALEPREPAPATQPSLTLEAVQRMSQHQAVRLSDEGAACLQRAMEALNAEQFRSPETFRDSSGDVEMVRKTLLPWKTDDRVTVTIKGEEKEGRIVDIIPSGLIVEVDGDRYTLLRVHKPGAIDLFRQARLLLTDRPEPTLGLIASLASTTDYNQAAALVGSLVSQWPEVMSRDDFARVFYARPEQARRQMLVIRDIAQERGEADLRLLWAFYRWHMESRQAAANDVARLARQLGPDSPAGQSTLALARAMDVVLRTGG